MGDPEGPSIEGGTSGLGLVALAERAATAVPATIIVVVAEAASGGRIVRSIRPGQAVEADPAMDPFVHVPEVRSLVARGAVVSIEALTGLTGRGPDWRGWSLCAAPVRRAGLPVGALCVLRDPNLGPLPPEGRATVVSMTEDVGVLLDGDGLVALPEGVPPAGVERRRGNRGRRRSDHMPSSLLSFDLLRSALTGIDRSSDLREAIDEVMPLMADYLRWSTGLSWRVTPDGGLEPLGEPWSEDPERLGAVRSLLTEPRTDGLRERVTASGLPQVVDDLRRHPDLADGPLVGVGLRGALGLPVRAHGRVVAVVELFDERPGAPEPITVDVLASVSLQLGLAQPAATSEAPDPEASFGHAEFIARAAHELRSPLGTLAVLARTLVDHHSELEDVAFLSMLEGLETRASQLSELAARLLDVARADLSEATLASDPLCLLKVVQGAVLDEDVPDDRSLVVEVDPVIHVTGDDAALREVVGNLVRNAVRHGGSTVRIAATEAVSVVEVVVEDDGPGVPDELVPRLFEPFARGPAAPAGSSGFGLRIVERLVRASSGSIRYEQRPGGGARFVIDLPRYARST